MKFFKAVTLIEMLMAIVIIGILVAIALPKFINFRTDAMKAAVAESLGAIRGGLYIQYVAINARGYDNALGPFPTVAEMNNNQVNRSGGAYVSEVVTDKMPENLFDGDGTPNNIVDATGIAKSTIIGATGGWAYEPNTGEVWANTSVAGENYL